jgi:rod shape-determining protein MreC
MYKRRKISPFTKALGIGVGVVLLVILLGRLDFTGWVLRGLSSLVRHGHTRAYTAEEINEMRDHLGSLETENAILRERVEDLQDQLDLSTVRPEIGYQLLPADVIYRDHARIFESALINRGTSDGVIVGMPVVDVRGVVGRIVSARAAVSRIELIASPDCSFGVIDQRSREIGVVRGSDAVKWQRPDTSGRVGWNNEMLPPYILELEYLSPSADISVNDTLITSGLSGITPPGLRVGEVVEIISRQEEDMFDIRVDPFADLEHLDTVAIVLYEQAERLSIQELLDETGSMMGPPAPE